MLVGWMTNELGFSVLFAEKQSIEQFLTIGLSMYLNSNMAEGEILPCKDQGGEMGWNWND